MLQIGVSAGQRESQQQYVDSRHLGKQFDPKFGLIAKPAVLRLPNMKPCSSSFAAAMSFVILSWVGCATGPDFKTYSTTLEPVKPGEARIWFYRPSKLIGSAVQPTVWLADVTVGKAQPGCFFYADRKPGDYEVKCTTEWADKCLLTVTHNKVHYVRLTMLPGVFVGHVLPKVVDEKTGLKEIEKCRLITADGANKNWQPSSPNTNSTQVIPARDRLSAETGTK